MTERGKRPHSAQVLERWAQEYATQHDLVKKRVGTGGLRRDAGGAPECTGWRLPGIHFTFRVKDDPYRMGDGPIRVEVVLEYRERGWGTVQVDLSPREEHRLEREQVSPLDLGFFGLEPAEDLSCLSVRYHLAHKVHGMTSPGMDERPNDRVRDLLDLFLLRELVDAKDLSSIREACVEVFQVRGGHEWPPDFRPPEFWEDEFEAVAERLGLGFTDFDDAVREARRFVERIEMSS